MSELVVPTVIAKCIMVKFLTNTWNLLRFLHDSEHSSVMKRSQGPRCMTGVSHLKKARQGLKTYHMQDDQIKHNADKIDSLPWSVNWLKL
jgi:hypothetical protein